MTPERMREILAGELEARFYKAEAQLARADSELMIPYFRAMSLVAEEARREETAGRHCDTCGSDQHDGCSSGAVQIQPTPALRTARSGVQTNDPPQQERE